MQSPFFVRFSSSRFAPTARVSWLWLAPGLSLVLLALAIIVWPELLAYLVAGALLTVGLALTAWGWTMRQATRRQVRPSNYEIYPGGTY